MRLPGRRGVAAGLLLAAAALLAAAPTAVGLHQGRLIGRVVHRAPNPTPSAVTLADAAIARTGERDVDAGGDAGAGFAGAGASLVVAPASLLLISAEETELDRLLTPVVVPGAYPAAAGGEDEAGSGSLSGSLSGSGSGSEAVKHAAGARVAVILERRSALERRLTSRRIAKAAEEATADDAAAADATEASLSASAHDATTSTAGSAHDAAASPGVPLVLVEAIDNTKAASPSSSSASVSSPPASSPSSPSSPTSIPSSSSSSSAPSSSPPSGPTKPRETAAASPSVSAAGAADGAADGDGDGDGDGDASPPHTDVVFSNGTTYITHSSEAFGLDQLVAMVGVIMLMGLGGLLMSPLHSALIGEILIGILVGPSLLKWIADTEFLQTVGHIGLCLLVLEGGLSLPPSMVGKVLGRSVLVALTGAGLAFFGAMGATVAMG